MDKNLELCIEINDLMYELKTLLPKNHPKIKQIDETMTKYQQHFRELYTASSKAEL